MANERDFNKIFSGNDIAVSKLTATLLVTRVTYLLGCRIRRGITCQMCHQLFGIGCHEGTHSIKVRHVTEFLGVTFSVM